LELTFSALDVIEVLFFWFELLFIHKTKPTRIYNARAEALTGGGQL
jgi:hypothetical protein